MPVDFGWAQYASSEVGTVWSAEAGTCTLLGPEGPDNPAPLGVGVMVSYRPSPKPALLVGVGVLAVC